MKEAAGREEQIVRCVLQHRRRQPRVGGKKLHRMLNASGELDFRVSRDYLFKVLRKNGLLVTRKKNYVKTTNSMHRFKKHKNAIKDLEEIGPEDVLVSDITYVETEEDHGYLFLVTDYATRRIMGHYFSRNLKAEGGIKALRKAIKNLADPRGTIHHSDRGLQYCCGKYTSLLEKNKMRVSMTEEDHVYENALAERVNGILKQEFLLGERLPSLKIAGKMVDEAVYIYNHERLHTSLNYRTPMEYYDEKTIKYAA